MANLARIIQERLVIGSALLKSNSTSGKHGVTFDPRLHVHPQLCKPRVPLKLTYHFVRETCEPIYRATLIGHFVQKQLSERSIDQIFRSHND
ncbi:hypothetical protein KIN20_010272 [Parelaphostrongylus tenuis]|uniref:Uncharacterized protein n=1 Tax=Parelaphostrongylus tenuis TaxID=148309 RepID=A0AAD5MT57_PARTN|nr:hypothetical protein KIN20_010272 [Parelaphostrongylus tenuis]